MKRTSACAAVAVLVVLAGCARDRKLAGQAAVTLKERVESSDRPDFARGDERGDQIWRDVRRFYRSHGYAPAWIEGRRPGREASELINAVHSARDEGLDPADYDLKALDQLRTEKSRNPFKKDALPPERRDPPRSEPRDRCQRGREDRDLRAARRKAGPRDCRRRKDGRSRIDADPAARPVQDR